METTSIKFANFSHPLAEDGVHTFSVLPQVPNGQFCVRAVNLRAEDKLGQKIQNVFVLDEMKLNAVALK